jgi:3-oxoadipate enol-lactonase
MSSGLRQVGAKKLFVEDTESDRPAVVFVHGLGGTTTFYDPLVTALGDAYRLVRFDLDGHGRSPLHGPVNVPALAEDVAALIAALPEKRAHVVAHSLGTLIAQHLAAKHPAVVSSLVLLGPVRAQADAAKTATRARAATVRENGMAAVADAIATHATSAAARAANPLVFGTVRELALGQNAEGYALACEALAAAENPDLSRITAPVLLLAGADDKVSTDVLRDELKQALSHVDIAIAPDCGHWTVTEAPAFVANQTRAFLATAGRKG